MRFVYTLRAWCLRTKQSKFSSVPNPTLPLNEGSFGVNFSFSFYLFILRVDMLSLFTLGLSAAAAYQAVGFPHFGFTSGSSGPVGNTRDTFHFWNL